MRSVVVNFNNRDYEFDLIKIQSEISAADFCFKPKENYFNEFRLIGGYELRIRKESGMQEYSTTNEILLRNPEMFSAFKRAIELSAADMQ